MKLTIEIKMDNAAFDEGPETEAARILRELAEQLEDNWYFAKMDNELPLIDINGNRVGSVRVEGDTQ